MRKILYLPVIALLMGLAACGGNAGGTSTANNEEIEEAAMEGRRAAKEFVVREWKDTMQLQQLLLEARAAQSKYEMENKKACAEAFDTAFVSTLRTVRPDVAAHLK